MALFQGYVEALLAIRSDLENNVLINDPTNYSKLTGTIDFLLNPALNSGEIESIMRATSNAGQYRPVEIKYQPQWGDEDTVTTDSSVTCTPAAQRRYNISTYNADKFVHTQFTLDIAYLREVLESGTIRGSELETGILKSMRLGRESMSAQLLADLVTNLGTNPARNLGPGAYTDIEMINNDGGVAVQTFDQIVNDLEENFMRGPIALIGQGGQSNSNRYFNRLAVGNVNTNAGVDVQEIASQFNMLYFKDQATTATLGDANRVLAIAPGLTQVYGYNLYASEDRRINSPDNIVQMTMPDPIYPIMWDVQLSYDRNCDNGNGLQGRWSVEVFKYFGLFTTPTEAFGGVYDDLNGFNGIVGYNITSA